MPLIRRRKRWFRIRVVRRLLDGQMKKLAKKMGKYVWLANVFSTTQTFF
jgi:hypothetical protein